MDVQLTNEQKAQLERLAVKSGREPSELLHDVVNHYIAEASRFDSAVREGLDAAERGDFVPTDEVWAGVERELNA
jgi:predicted transcriptional regulator